MSTQCIDCGGALANEQITGPMDHQHVLLIFAFDRNKPHPGVDTDERVLAIARDALLQLMAQIRDTEDKIEAFDKQILPLAREDEVCRRLMMVLTIGPVVATALVATVSNLDPSPRSGISQPGSAWFRNNVRPAARSGSVGSANERHLSS